MSKCTNCGADLFDGAKFCTNCGTPVASIAPDFGVDNAVNNATAFAAATNTANNQNQGGTAFQNATSAPRQQHDIYADRPVFGGSNFSQPVQSANAAPDTPVTPDIPVAPIAPNATVIPDESATSENIVANNMSTEPINEPASPAIDAPATSQTENTQMDVQPQLDTPNPFQQNNFNQQDYAQPNMQQPQPEAPNPFQQNAFSQQVPPQQGNFQQSFNYQPVEPAKKKGLGAGAIIAIVCGVIALIAIILIVVIVITSGSKGYKKPIETFEDGLNDRDAKKILSVLPLDDTSSALLGLGSDYLGDELIDEMGLNDSSYTINIKIKDADKLSESELYDVADSNTFSYFSSDSYTLSEGYEVHCTAVINEDGDYDSEDVTFTVCKWDGKWYIFDIN
ncbi:zinc-ribbon domain-containing protein [Agathobacter sp.]